MFNQKFKFPNFPDRITSKNSYKFPKVACSDLIKEEIIRALESVKVDYRKVKPSALVSSLIGYDYVLPAGVNHDILSEYARLHHVYEDGIFRPKDSLGLRLNPYSKEFLKVFDVIVGLNPILNNYKPICDSREEYKSHHLHGIASNIPPEELWFNGISTPGKNNWVTKYQTLFMEKITDFSETNTLISEWISELRDITIQNDRMRFRKNMSRIGEVIAYEISKVLKYEKHTFNTPLCETISNKSRCSFI